MGYRQFDLKIVADDNPNGRGHWIRRVVPDRWPGDGVAQPDMMRSPPDYNTVPVPGFHVVQIIQSNPGPSDQPGTMHQRRNEDALDATRRFKQGDAAPDVPEDPDGAPEAAAPRFG